MLKVGGGSIRIELGGTRENRLQGGKQGKWIKYECIAEPTLFLVIVNIKMRGYLSKGHPIR